MLLVLQLFLFLVLGVGLNSGVHGGDGTNDDVVNEDIKLYGELEELVARMMSLNFSDSDMFDIIELVLSIVEESNATTLHNLEFSKIIETKMAFESSAKDCWSYTHRCRSRNSVIYVPGHGGFEDRLYTYDIFATIANYLCAKVYVPPVWSTFVPYKNNFKLLDISLVWDDFLDHDDTYCGDRGILTSALYEEEDLIFYNTSNGHQALPHSKDINTIANWLQTNGHASFDALVDDHIYDTDRTMEKNLRKVIELQAQGKSFLWSIDNLQNFKHRGQLAAIFQEEIRTTAQPMSAFTTRLGASKILKSKLSEFLQFNNISKDSIMLLHIRRTDNLKECIHSSPQDVHDLLLEYTRHCSDRFHPGMTVAFHTDEKDSSYIEEVTQKISSLGYVPLHLDVAITAFLRTLFNSQALELKYDNNYFVYGILFALRENNRWNLGIHHPQVRSSEDADAMNLVKGSSCVYATWDSISCESLPRPRRGHDGLFLSPYLPLPMNHSMKTKVNDISYQKKSLRLVFEEEGYQMDFFYDQQDLTHPEVLGALCEDFVVTYKLHLRVDLQNFDVSVKNKASEICKYIAQREGVEFLLPRHHKW